MPLQHPPLGLDFPQDTYGVVQGHVLGERGRKTIKPHQTDVNSSPTSNPLPTPLDLPVTTSRVAVLIQPGVQEHHQLVAHDSSSPRASFVEAGRQGDERQLGNAEFPAHGGRCGLGGLVVGVLRGLEGPVGDVRAVGEEVT